MNLSLLAGQTVALYRPTSLTIGPFPSNALTTADSAQRTGLHIELPSSYDDSCDPSSSPSVCSNSALLNQLDGFSVNPRVMVCFSGAVDPPTLASGISITPVGGGAPVAINQIIFDQGSNCAFAKPNQVLNQQSKYLLTITNSVRDSQGKKVKEQDAFKDCLKGNDPYCQELAQAVGSNNAVVAASLFTTMSATTWLEQARQYVDAHEPALVLPAGLPFLFSVNNLKSIEWSPAQSGLGPQDIPLGALSGVGKVAFGLYFSPNFLNPANGTIATTGTNLPFSGPVPVPISIPGVSATIPTSFVPVSFHVFLPPGQPPAGGYPLVIYGHGTGDNQFGAPTYIATTLAQKGFATLAMEITGHGYGAGSTVKLTDNGGKTSTVLTPGRGILLPGSSVIGSTDGCILPGAVGVRDCLRQTAVDLVALIDTIQKTNGLGLGIDPNQVYYVGQSLGGLYGTLFQAVDPAVKAAVMSGDGGTEVDVARLSISGRSLAIPYLESVNSALLNVALGEAPPEPYWQHLAADGYGVFNQNYAFRDSAPVVNSIAGAMAIQAAFEAADWLDMLGDPLSYAPHLRTAPLAGMPVKATLFQFGLGDLEVPNATESAVIRAANAQSSSWFFRLDVAAFAPTNPHPELLGIMMSGFPLPILPHRILSNPTLFDPTNPNPAEMSIALAEQQQVAAYFASGGSANPDPNQFLTGTFSPSDNLFQPLLQVPTTLPEQLNFLQFAP